MPKQLLGLIIGILFWGIVSLVQAETRTFNANIRFLAPINLASTIDPNLGNYTAGAAGRNFIMGTDGSISGINADAYAGGANAGSVAIYGSAFNNIDIVAQNIVNNGGVSITAISCNYGGAGSTDCLAGISAAAAPTDAGTILLLGLGVATTAAHVDGNSAAPAFDIVVTYN